VFLNANDANSYSGSGTVWYDLSGNYNNANVNGGFTIPAVGPNYFNFSTEGNFPAEAFSKIFGL
jgi:hypothetical protein